MKEDRSRCCASAYPDHPPAPWVIARKVKVVPAHRSTVPHQRPVTNSHSNAWPYCVSQEACSNSAIPKARPLPCTWHLCHCIEQWQKAGHMFMPVIASSKGKEHTMTRAPAQAGFAKYVYVLIIFTIRADQSQLAGAANTIQAALQCLGSS